MNEKEFLLWFKGYSDSIGVSGPNLEQWSKIQNEAALAFNKVVPYMPNTEPSYCGAIPVNPPQKFSNSVVNGIVIGPSC